MRKLLQSNALPALLGLGVIASVTALPERDPSRRAPDGPLSSGSRIDPLRSRADRLVIRFVAGEDERNEAFQRLLEKVPGARTAPHFAQSPRAITAARLAGEERLGAPLPDLNRYRRLLLPPAMDPTDAAALLAELNALDCVSVAFAEPLAEPASLEPGEDSGSPGAGQPAAGTPDFTPLQLYLGDAPIGLGMTAISSVAGARGRGVRLIDIEAGWNWSHEDLPEPFYRFGPAIDGWENHGTAVLGELVGKANGRGVEGIVPDLEVGAASFSEIGVAAAIDLASSVLDVGDIILIELHAPGPNAPHGGGQFGFLPMEYWQDVFDAIRVATANGRIVVEAAGNGQQDLDDPIYGGLFDRNVRDSGAVLVAAGTPLDLKAEWFTNHGSRIDLHGWGTSITTTGYGTLHDAGRNALYTTGFGGTSGASPMVCGAIASLQGMCLATYGFPLDRDLVVEILGDTGSPAQGAKRIGPRPDLARAHQRLAQGVGRIRGNVREAGTGRPLANVRLVLDGTRSIRSDARGRFWAAVLPGAHSLVADGFWHQELRHDFEVAGHETSHPLLRLDPRPAGELVARVTHRSQPAVDAPVRLHETPVAGHADADGELRVSVPSGSYLVSAGPLPGTGVAWRNVAVTSDPLDVSLDLPEAETFEGSSGGFLAESGWELGTPSFPTPSSGSRLWATGLHGTYGDHTYAVLTSSPLSVAGASAIHLSFSHWYRIEAAWDGGQVQVWDGSHWQVAVPIGGYPMDALSALEWGPGYSGASSGWEAALFDLFPFANEDFRIRFVFASDESVTDVGWFLDDVAISIDAHGPAEIPAPDSTKGLSVALEPAWPNPFSETTRLRYAIASAGRVSLTVHDVSGRRVRRLLDAERPTGVHEAQWDGADDAGSPLPAGMYYLRLDAGAVSRVTSILRVR